MKPTAAESAGGAGGSSISAIIIPDTLRSNITGMLSDLEFSSLCYNLGEDKTDLSLPNWSSYNARMIELLLDLLASSHEIASCSVG